jgi:hypothetical protein
MGPSSEAVEAAPEFPTEGPWRVEIVADDWFGYRLRLHNDLFERSGYWWALSARGARRKAARIVRRRNRNDARKQAFGTVEVSR